MSNERQLTKQDREKIQRLLESGTLENVTLALSLIEETAGQEDIADIFTMNVIVELICLGITRSNQGLSSWATVSDRRPEFSRQTLKNLDIMVRTGHLILKCPDTWNRFSAAVVDPNLLTSQRYLGMLSEIDFVHDRFPSKRLRLGDLPLNDLTAISSCAAEQLVGNEGEWKYGFERLKLGGLSFLSDAVAKSLSQFNGEIRLDGLTELTDAAAENLGQHMGKLSLKGLARLSHSATGSLSKHGELKTNTKIRAQIKKHVSSARKITRNSTRTGQRVLTNQQTTKIRKLLRGRSSDQAQTAVQLMEAAGATVDDVSDVFSTSIISLLVNTWDVDVWNVLAPLLTENQLPNQEFIDLVCQRILTKSAPFMTSFSVSLFNRVGAPLGQLLTQSGSLQELGKVWDNWPRPEITELSEAGAQLLVMSGKGHDPYLGALPSLSDAAAKSLSKYEGNLDLDGLTEISVAAALSLSKHEGDLSLKGLLELSDSAAKSLGKHTGHLWLNGITELSDAAAESLSKHEGWLYLDGLTKLTDAAAESHSKHKGGLGLDGLTELSDAAAESFLKHEGEIYLDGLTELSDAAAESLSKHEGELTLKGLTELSDASAESLSKHEGRIYFGNQYYAGELDNLPASAAQILRDANPSVWSYASRKP